jgi:sugar/nucleoside kinase (ribokinase family)
MSTNIKEKVMVAGHLCIDISPRFPEGVDYDIGRMFSPGVLTTIAEPVFSTGGPVSNTGLAMAKLGVDVALNGKVGDDAFGNIIRELIGKENSKSLKVVSGQNTSYTLVFAVPGVDRFVLHNPGTNDTFGPEDVDYDAAQKCRLFHFGYPPLMKRMYQNQGKELVEIFKRIKELGITTSLDMAMPDPGGTGGDADWRRILEGVLPYVDIFVPSVEEISFMLDRNLFDKKKAQSAGADPVLAYDSDDCTRFSGELLSMGAKIVTIKCGINGLYLRTAGAEQISSADSASPTDVNAWTERELWASTFEANNFASALGAGDATIAGFLCAFLRAFSPSDALQTANTVGWQNVQAVDALSGIQDWPSTLKLMSDKGRKRNQLVIETDGWRFNDEHQLFYGPNDKSQL